MVARSLASQLAEAEARGKFFFLKHLFLLFLTCCRSRCRRRRRRRRSGWSEREDRPTDGRTEQPASQSSSRRFLSCRHSPRFVWLWRPRVWTEKQHPVSAERHAVRTPRRAWPPATSSQSDQRPRRRRQRQQQRRLRRRPSRSQRRRRRRPVKQHKIIIVKKDIEEKEQASVRVVSSYAQTLCVAGSVRGFHPPSERFLGVRGEFNYLSNRTRRVQVDAIQCLTAVELPAQSSS